MSYFIAYMLIGLAISVWSISGADAQNRFEETLQLFGIEEVWLAVVALALSIVFNALLWPISLAVFISDFIKWITENK